MHLLRDSVCYPTVTSGQWAVVAAAVRWRPRRSGRRQGHGGQGRARRHRAAGRRRDPSRAPPSAGRPPGPARPPTAGRRALPSPGRVGPRRQDRRHGRSAPDPARRSGPAGPARPAPSPGRRPAAPGRRRWRPARRAGWSSSPKRATTGWIRPPCTTTITTPTAVKTAADEPMPKPKVAVAEQGEGGLEGAEGHQGAEGHADQPGDAPGASQPGERTALRRP